MDTVQSVMKLLVSRLPKFAGVETNLRGLCISSVSALALRTGFSLMMGVDGRLWVLVEVHRIILGRSWQRVPRIRLLGFGLLSLVGIYELLS